MAAIADRADHDPAARFRTPAARTDPETSRIALGRYAGMRDARRRAVITPFLSPSRR